ncbi:transposase [Streptomyces sp. NBC_00841]|uniref:transposase n=1 Tax=unclassified Streptomyces TaxID=2593676 RepID=UPI002255E2B1|nr:MULTISPECIES: transposase [unclassified Streptomyces]MCX4535478.1 transposase [Streptomyces sp. NBC_01669]WRZ99232.1 transposase [Streptomyces sp. NBC_00841]
MTVIQAAQPQRKFRGENKARKWKKPDGGQVSVMVLPLAVTDPADVARLEKLFGSMWSIKRGVQRDARNKVDAYWCAKRERDRDGAKAARQRLGLNREALERCAYKHLENSGHLKHHATKALAMHMADEVWNGVQRHLFADATGKRHGRPKVGRWHDFTRIPGRARSHTTANKWETFRLVGALHGHVMAYTDGGRHSLMQPRRMGVPALPKSKVPTGKLTVSGKPGTRKATWWDHTGPLAVVFAGGPNSSAGDLVLPVRVPQQPGQWARVDHFLANPGRWHKVDLVRRRKASAPGGWVYEAHLMVLGPGYASPAVREMREQAAALNRVGGVDGNVSNLSIVSFPADLNPAEGRPESTEIVLNPADRALMERQAKKRRGRARALERSRRATNAAQYGLSKKQVKRAARRAEKGLKAKAVAVPGGARAARSDGVPKQAFRRDQLSGGYRELRARQAEHAASIAEHRRHRARTMAREIIAKHGPVLVVEDCDIRTWYRLWGKRLSQTTPGMFIAALDRECTAAGRRLVRASTWSTALSQHCLCGERVSKTLRDRDHKCIACGLAGKRDLVSAALAAFVRFADVDDPKTAYLDTAQSRHAQIIFREGLEEALRKSTTQSQNTVRGAGRVAVPRQCRATSAPRTAAGRSRANPDETPQGDHAGTPGSRPGCIPQQLTLWGDMRDKS